MAMASILPFLLVRPNTLGLLAEPATEPGTEPVTELTTEPTTEPVTELTTEPATEPGTEPATEPTTEPTTEPATEPVTELATAPATEPVTELATEPATEPVTEPTTEPSPLPVHFRGAGPQTLPTGSAITQLDLVAPATVNDNDKLLAFVRVSAGTNYINSVPSGWAVAAFSRAGNASVTHEVWVFEKDATGSEGGQTFSWGISGAGEVAEGQMIALYADDGGKLHQQRGTARPDNAGTGTTMSVQSVTCDVADSLVVAYNAYAQVSGTASVSMTGPTGGGFTTIGQYAGNGVNAATNPRAWLAYREDADVGETPSGTFTYGANLASRSPISVSLIYSRTPEYTQEAIDYVGAGTYAMASGTSLSLNTGADVADGDLLVAVVLCRNGSFTPPAGWATQLTLNQGNNTLHFVTKDTVVDADENVSTSWTQGTSGIFQGQILCFRAPSGVKPVLTARSQNGGGYPVNTAGRLPAPSAFADQDGQVALSAAAFINGTTHTTTAPSGGTLVSDGTSNATRRLEIAVREGLQKGEGIAGLFQLSTGPASAEVQAIGAVISGT